MNIKKRLDIKLIALSVVTGILIGLLVSLFRVLIPFLNSFVLDILSLSKERPLYILIFLLLFIALGCISSYCVHKEPNISGSGIPQVSGKLQHKLKYSWLSALVYKYIGGLAAIGSGLTLGREGPSVQIGASIAEGVAKLNKEDEETTRSLIISGAGSGLGVAFNAPISGIIFSLEELSKRILSSSFMITGLTVLTANSVSVLIIGNQVSIPVNESYSVAVALWPAIIILGVLCALSGTLFTKLVLLGKKFYALLPLPKLIKHLIPFIATALILLMDASLLGSGSELMLLPNTSQLSPELCLYYYLAKFFLLLVAFCSGIPGGIFFPLLVLGSLLGSLYASLLASLGLIPESAILFLSVIAMSAHFAAIVRAPLTGIFLILEMTGGSLHFLMPIMIITVSAYFVSDLLGAKPIYEELLHYNLTQEKQ